MIALRPILLLLLGSGLLLGLPMAHAQQVEAQLDTNAIRIGEQFNLTLSVEAPVGSEVVFPETGENLLIKEIEVLERMPADSVVEGNLKKVTQRLRLTSFDSGYHAIPPLYIKIVDPETGEMDSAATQAMLMEVQTVAVDTAQPIKDIVAPFEAPLTFEEVWPWIMAGLLFLVGGFIVWQALRRAKLKKLNPKPKEAKKPIIPPHVKALESLQKLQKEELWQQGQHKAYQSELTEILRQYIEDRYQIPALEQTSEEILAAFQVKRILPNQLFEQLTGVLRLADMVKFAKYLPVGQEHEKSFEAAKGFVEQTIPQPEPEKQLS